MGAVVRVEDGDVTVATIRIDGDVPHLFVVDAFARLTLAARRLGWSCRLAEASPELGEVAALLGLEEGRQAERREQPAVEVEEVVQADQPPA
jgi:hypothetical protein